MKIISFSLWGQDPKYLIGAIRNAELAQEIYPDWICRFYIAQSAPYGLIAKLKKYSNVEVVELTEFGDWKTSTWRFVPLGDPNVEAVISRDTDSRPTLREKAAVDEWVASGKSFHIMKDHPWHFTYPILAGMFGGKGNSVPDIKQKLANYKNRVYYHYDQDFLRDEIYSLTIEDCLVHDEFIAKNPFPIKRNGLEFVGQVFDEEEMTVDEHVDVLRKFYNGK